MPSKDCGVANGFADLHAEVLIKLREMIVSGEFQPGSRIVERLLCERLKISRTPLREAVKVLAAEGLVELLPNRGARVADFREHDIRETFEVMAALESLAGELTAIRATEDEISEIRALHYQMYAHFLRRQLPDYFRLNQEIHVRIVDGAHNAVLKAHFDVLNRRVTHARYLETLWTDEIWASAMKEHETIVDALVLRDGERLGRVLRQHLTTKLQRVLACFGAQKASAETAGKPARRRRSADKLAPS